MYRLSRFGWLACAGIVCAATPQPDLSRAKTTLAHLPLRFEENRGQSAPGTRFIARTGGYRIDLTATGPALAVGSRRVDLRLLHSDPSPAVIGEQPMPTVTNYFVGKRDQWHVGIANFARVRYQQVYRGIDTVYYGNQSQMEYDFIVAPGADPKAIRLQFAGADRVRITPEGDLSVEAGGQPVIQKKPRVYQQGHEIAARYVLHGRDQASIELGAYDRTKELVIDPILVYCTYFGSSGYDQVNAVKMGPKGRLYIAGQSTTGELPYIDGAYNNNNAGLTDIFLAIIDTTDSTFPLKYFSYIGGTSVDTPNALAVDGQGVFYITGTTTSTDYPLAGNNISSSAATVVNAFVTKLDPSLWGVDSLLYSTYLGGTDGNNSGNAIAVDSSNKIYVVGTTKSTDFQVTTSAYAQVLYGPQDAFITKIDPDSGSPLVYSTYMGGELSDDGRAVAVGSDGLIYFAASTNSTMFPLEGPSYRQNLQGDLDIALGVIDPNQFGESSMRYSTYLGGSDVEEVRAMAINSDGNIVLTGYTLSQDFPTTLGALSRAPLGSSDVFVTIVNPSRPSTFLVYSTYFGGSQGDVGYDVMPVDDGTIYVTGYTLSSDLFTVNAPQPGWGGGTDIFITQFKPGTPGRAGILFSTYFGKTGQYVGKGLALGPDGSLYTVGYASIGLPSGGSPNAQNYYAGYDGFLIVVK